MIKKNIYKNISISKKTDTCYIYLDNPKKIDEQILNTQAILKNLKTGTLSSTLAANAINKYL